MNAKKAQSKQLCLKSRLILYKKLVIFYQLFHINYQSSTFFLVTLLIYNRTVKHIPNRSIFIGIGCTVRL